MVDHSLRPDAVSDVLELVRMRADLVVSSFFRAPWGVSFPAGPSHFHIIKSGALWVRVNDHVDPIRAEAGDIVMLPRGAGHAIADSPQTPALSIADVPDDAFDPDTATLRWGGRDAETQALCCRFQFNGPVAEQLLAALPPIIHIDAHTAPSPDWLDASSRFLMHETVNPSQGSTAMVSRIVDLIFIQTLRAWANKRDRDLGWLGGLGDLRIGRALSAIHGAPAQKWTAVELATIAGLSRSAFTARFSEIVGEPPLSYVTRWRMSLAYDLLRSSATPIGDIARRVGYASDASFTKAFRAQFGAPPIAVRRNEQK